MPVLLLTRVHSSWCHLTRAFRARTARAIQLKGSQTAGYPCSETVRKCAQNELQQQFWYIGVYLSIQAKPQSFGFAQFASCSPPPSPQNTFLMGSFISWPRVFSLNINSGFTQRPESMSWFGSPEVFKWMDRLRRLSRWVGMAHLKFSCEWLDSAGWVDGLV